MAACNPIHPAVLRFDRVQRALAMGKLPDPEDCKGYSAAMAAAAASVGQERPSWTERELGCPVDWRQQISRLTFETTLKGWMEDRNLTHKQAFDILSKYFNRRWSTDNKRGKPSNREDEIPFVLLTLHGGLPEDRHIENALKRSSG